MENILNKQKQNSNQPLGRTVMATSLRKIKQRIDKFGNVISEEIIEAQDDKSKSILHK